MFNHFSNSKPQKFYVLIKITCKIIFMFSFERNDYTFVKKILLQRSYFLKVWRNMLLM